MHAKLKSSGPPGQRLVSLDVFRGATIAAMMLVNNPGNWDAIYPQLDHAEWHGWTFTDSIFPFFLWIVGVAVPLSTAKRLQRGESRAALLIHAFRRAVILFALGLFLAFFSFTINGSYQQAGGFSPWLSAVAHTIRIPGVLQRIAICYFLSTLIYLFTTLRGCIGWVVGLLAGYWVMMKCIPVPGQGVGLLTREGNFSAYIDERILGAHTWHGLPQDPEGIISTIPAIASCLLGILAGELLQMKRSAEQKTAWLFVLGNLLMLAGTVANIWLPINKNLWTSSYALFMAGLASNAFAVIYWLVDVKGYQRGTKPFAIYGMNAIAVFLLSGILGRISLEIKVPGNGGQPLALKRQLFETCFNNPLGRLGLNPQLCSLSWALAYLALLYAVAYIMYRQRWFLKF